MKYEEWKEYPKKNGNNKTSTPKTTEHCIIIHIHIKGTKEIASAMTHTISRAVEHLGLTRGLEIAFLDMLAHEVDIPTQAE